MDKDRLEAIGAALGIGGTVLVLLRRIGRPIFSTAVREEIKGTLDAVNALQGGQNDNRATLLHQNDRLAGLEQSLSCVEEKVDNLSPLPSLLERLEAGQGEMVRAITTLSREVGELRGFQQAQQQRGG